MLHLLPLGLLQHACLELCAEERHRTLVQGAFLMGRPSEGHHHRLHLLAGDVSLGGKAVLLFASQKLRSIKQRLTIIGPVLLEIFQNVVKEVQPVAAKLLFRLKIHTIELTRLGGQFERHHVYDDRDLNTDKREQGGSNRVWVGWWVRKG